MIAGTTTPMAAPGSTLPPNGALPCSCPLCKTSLLEPEFCLPVFDGPLAGIKPGRERWFHRCPTCGYTRGGSYEKSSYSDYYRSLRLDYHLDHDEDHERYRLVRGALGPNISKVLDIGCGSGTFLSSLPLSVKKYGIEPAEEAAQAAARNGIRILSQEEVNSGAWKGFFDAVTGIDVAEHIEDLIAFRELVCHVLRPGGRLVLLTGNRDSPASRFLGPYWYYLHYAEHVSFLTQKALCQWLEPAFMEIRAVQVTHHRIPARQWIRSLATFPVKWTLVRLFGLRRVNFYFCLPAERDHMLVSAIHRL